MSCLRAGLIALALTIGSLGCTGAQAQSLRTESVLPRTTDPAINGWLGAHFVAFDPGIAPRDRLFLYLHGQGGTGGGATELVKTAAGLGFHAVGLTYPNDWQPFNLCTGSTSTDCAENVRREILDGIDHSPLITVTPVECVENRLIKLLAFLHAAHPTEGWDQYVVGGQIQWSQIVVWGHSQGGGNAGVMARYHALAGVCTSAPAADGGAGAPAPWWAVHATPSDRYIGLCHTQDQIGAKLAFWSALGMAQFGSVQDVATVPSPYASSHSLSTSVAPAVAGQFHNSVAQDSVTPRDAQGVPVYKPVWQYMINGGTAPGSATFWNDVVYATVPGTSGPVNVMMDIYAPTSGGPGPWPVLVWIHGGGWSGGTHDSVPGFALGLRSRGIAVASISYRLSGQAIFPAQIHDCKGAIRYLRAHAATFNIDPTRIGAWGSSAGGHLAALVSTSGNDPTLEGSTGGNLDQSSAVMAGCSYFGPTDLLAMQADCGIQLPGCSFNHDDPTSPESGLLGVNAPGQGLAWLRANLSNPLPPFPDKAALAVAVNPITHLDPFDPPMFIGHGDVDTTVPINQSVRLQAGLWDAAVPVTYLASPGAGHGALGSVVDAEAADWMAGMLLGLIPCSTGDVTAVGGSAEDLSGPDGQLTVDDAIAFLSLFGDGAGCPDSPPGPCNRADVCGVGGPPEPVDGQLTVDDLIYFVNSLVDGC